MTALLLLLLYMVLVWCHGRCKSDLALVVAAAAAAGTSAVGLGMVVANTVVVVVAVVAAAGHTVDIAWVAGLLLADSWPPLEGQPYRLLHT